MLMEQICESKPCIATVVPRSNRHKNTRTCMIEGLTRDPTSRTHWIKALAKPSWRLEPTAANVCFSRTM